mmetsp:Transcript_15946/g.44097  ORF Transcript_15946/g.44097 Transcript_15946/m.44097 type:complete len:212 (-) Transcript_15946:217-852(-)
MERQGGASKLQWHGDITHSSRVCCTTTMPHQDTTYQVCVNLLQFPSWNRLLFLCLAFQPCAFGLDLGYPLFISRFEFLLRKLEFVGLQKKSEMDAGFQLLRRDIIMVSGGVCNISQQLVDALLGSQGFQLLQGRLCGPQLQLLFSHDASGMAVILQFGQLAQFLDGERCLDMTASTKNVNLAFLLWLLPNGVTVQCLRRDIRDIQRIFRLR